MVARIDPSPILPVAIAGVATQQDIENMQCIIDMALWPPCSGADEAVTRSYLQMLPGVIVTLFRLQNFCNDRVAALSGDNDPDWDAAGAECANVSALVSRVYDVGRGVLGEKKMKELYFPLKNEPYALVLKKDSVSLEPLDATGRRNQKIGSPFVQSRSPVKIVRFKQLKNGDNNVWPGSSSSI